MCVFGLQSVAHVNTESYESPYLCNLIKFLYYCMNHCIGTSLHLLSHVCPHPKDALLASQRVAAPRPEKDVRLATGDDGVCVCWVELDC